MVMVTMTTIKKIRKAPRKFDLELIDFFKKLSDSPPFKREKRFISLVNYFRTIERSNDLNLFARVLKTDKWGDHYYT